jgi:hypothetical protein
MAQSERSLTERARWKIAEHENVVHLPAQGLTDADHKHLSRCPSRACKQLC